MRPDQEMSLVGGGDCFSHWHSEDRKPTQALLQGLESIANQVPVTANVQLTGKEDFVVVNTATSSVTVTMPRAANGLEIEIMKLSPAYLINVVPKGTDTILGTTGVTISVGNASIRFKAIGTDWRPI